MEKLKAFLKDFVIELLTAIVIAFIIVKFIAMPVRVEGSSMEPNLYENNFGFSLIINKNNIKRFDTVVIDVGEKLIVKRVIGLPNDTVEYKNDVLFINGVEVSEDFAHETATNDLKVSLNDGEYFCLGDHRSVSKDSRYYGNFTKDDIKSKGVLILFPFSNIGVK